MITLFVCLPALQILTSALWGQADAVKPVSTLLVTTHAGATLGTPLAVMGAHAMVSPVLLYNQRMPNVVPYVDINECSSSSTNDCQHSCVNTPGSYTCQCNSGFRLNSDGRTCTGVCNGYSKQDKEHFCILFVN